MLIWLITQKVSGANGRALDLSGVQLTLGQAATLSDVFSVEWGLRKLFLKECDLDEHVGTDAISTLNQHVMTRPDP